MTNPAGKTAYGPMMIVAAEQHFPENQRLLEDNLAARFLPAGLKAAAALARVTSLSNFIFKLINRRSAGVWMEVLCRKRFIDDQLHRAVDSGIEAVVNLGAGLDTRAYRLVPPGSIPVFEVDLPDNIISKEKVLKRVFGRVPQNVSLIPVDFDKDNLETALASFDCRMDSRRYFVIWEAVTQYLSETGVRSTFSVLARAKAGSRLAFTYILKDFIDGHCIYGLDHLYRHYCQETYIWQFGLTPGRTAAFLAEFGWKELQQVGSREYISMYLEPAGRVSSVMEIERAVYAEKM